MKRVFVFLSTIIICLQLAACSTNKDSKEKQEEFPTTSPIVIDTEYNNDYVSDINAIKNVEIRARVKGYIEKIHVDEGKFVKQGQILFSISSQEYKEEILKAKAMLKSTIAEAKAAELNLQNVKLLVDKNVVSKTEYEMAKAKLDALNAKIEEAQSHETSAKLKLSFTEIKAPFDGIVDRIPNKIGSLIDEGTLLTTISDNKEVFAYFNVSEKEYLDFAKTIRESAKSEVSLILANNETHDYKGNIETIEGEFDKNTGSIAFRARFSNPERILKHGSSGKVRIKNHVKNALVIPQKSTFEIQDKVYVFVVDKNNKIQTRNIVPKLRIPHLFIIQSGVSTSDRIIYEGIQNLKDGMTIIPEMIAMDKIITELRSK
ncbi:efflux RND transporter periplasmic adaptor subunit [Arcicella rosea]|uniref:Membrane fusion protein (Multidrug efflux system) n=1 Tax=Arcicella rosea TaxID=502909 RepID=A0A841EMH7_9BACT|nr:efflux RND transporter periplasmic adaptor subunit [Arcicella rosea]MBB6001520.1 membrane fusion protein (multidrug efflux system) [Arcicella rosea]